MILNKEDNIRCSECRTADVDVLAHAVDEEVAEVGEEFVIEEVVTASSRASAVPKNPIATRGRVSEDCCPFDTSPTYL